MCGPQPEIRLSALDQSEVDDFLRFLFKDVAGRPEPLLLRETAAVVRYLRLLALKGLPRTVVAKGPKAVEQYEETPAYRKNSDARRVLEQMASAIWGNLSQFGQIEPCSPGKAIRFLRRHAGTYLAGKPLRLPRVLKLVQELEVTPKKPGEPKPFAPPLIVSRSRSAHGTGNSRLQDDLSERIYVALHALKRSSVKSPQNRIADALVYCVKSSATCGRRGDGHSKPRPWAGPDGGAPPDPPNASQRTACATC